MSAKNLTLYIPGEIAEKMEPLTEVNWSKIARDAIEKYIEERLDTSIPQELLNRLRTEMGEEFVNGKTLATEKIVPSVSYKKLAGFFNHVRSNVQYEVSQIEEHVNIPPWEISVDETKIAIDIINKHFSEIPKDATPKYREGVFSVLKDVWDKLEAGKSNG